MLRLTDQDIVMLEGGHGPAVKMAMKLLAGVGQAMGARGLVDIEMAHIDGCLYHGRAGLDFARRLVEGGGRVAVPTTLNVASLDLLHPDLYRGDETTAQAARALMDAYVELGCQPTWTCAPYQLPLRPRLGQQIAWGESNAIVFANSVLGARTERYGDFMDIACAITGRAPYAGLHKDEGRLGTVSMRVDVDPGKLDGDLAYPLLGHVLGRLAGTDIVVVEGLDERADEDRLRAMGAAAASSGAVAMFHVAGVTPEAPTAADAFGGRQPVRVVSVDGDDLLRALDELGPADGPLSAVSVGTPHMSIRELRRLANLVTGRTSRIPFYVNTSRQVLGEAIDEGLVVAVEAFGATFVTDTCTYITPIIDDVSGPVMTNSGKWAFYAPSNLGVEVAFGSLADCVASADRGVVAREGEWS